jgi:hypothetical protein
MPRVHVALQEGFQNDTVTVQLAGREVYRKSGVSTRMQIGLADKFDLDVTPGPAELHVEVPSRNAARSVPLTVPADGELFVGISLSHQGAVTSQVSDEPFRYA